ncbi:armadillo-type protein [Microdochium bolleyi]|uniref:Armadillo-type protein n=1 Tax=Microdochium bolleyi TaxID=196109 RepID=A0A136IXJ5_9PEZI|nr:armadillo-type protein [Microdochium bolleyi]
MKRGGGALSAASLANLSCPKVRGFNSSSISFTCILTDMTIDVQVAKPAQDRHAFGTSEEASPVESILASLSKQKVILQKQSAALEASSGEAGSWGLYAGSNSASNSVPLTPAHESIHANDQSRSAGATAAEESGNTEEVSRLKLQLAQAQDKISRLGQELSSTRPVPKPLDSGIGGSPFEVDATFNLQPDYRPPQMAGPFLPDHRNFYAPSRDSMGSWPAYDDSRSDTSEPTNSAGFNRARHIWNSRQGPPAFGQLAVSPAQVWNSRPGNVGYMDSGMPYSAPLQNNFRPERLTPDIDPSHRSGRDRRGQRVDNRFQAPGLGGQAYETGFSYGGTTCDVGADCAGPSAASMAGNMSMFPGYPQAGNILSPLASEFTITPDSESWKTDSFAAEGQTYLPTTEPLNYRRLLDRNVNCNWKYIVDKIVCNNDQQASIFLQQKLKVGTPEQKYAIVEAIVAQAYPLMVNRFGNFLVQRCFEHGTPEQVIKIAEGIRGNTLSLSMDPFGCHVVQKAFDSVPEDYKAIMVHELLRCIPETVIHRYACHVWQKLFELRWTESPPQIMKFVNEALCGMWHEVALGETGSLVVQNIFENCLEEDKRPCIEEVLANIDIVAHGQFGNWCIQHVCEHGAPADRSRAVDHVIRFAAEYSMDQYASKVVEKCLKIGGAEFLSRYLDRVCEGRMDRPRIPLIDIASDQYGNYLVQWILTHAGLQHREIVAAHIRKHMVSLRGSKFGSRVGMLCTNPAVATRPGPGAGASMARMPPGPRYGARPPYH